MWASYLLSALLCALPLTAALSPQILEERDNVEVKSYTRMGPSRVHNVKTYYTTSTKPCTVTKTVYEKKTQYTKAKKTFTTTTTTTKTVKAYAPYTPTIPASKGFIPVDKSIPGASYDPAASLAKREAVATSPAQPFLAARDGRPGSYFNKRGYPQRVDVVHWKKSSKCYEKIVTKTKNDYKCKNKVPKTVTKTATATTTKYPSTAAPFYAACATNNRATVYKNQPIFELVVEQISNPDPNAVAPGYSFALVANATNGYECCVAAIQDSPPAAFWGIGESTTDNTDNICLVFSLDSCTAPQKNPTTEDLSFEIRAGEEGQNNGRVGTVGNAYCGQWFRGCVVNADGTEECNPPRPA